SPGKGPTWLRASACRIRWLRQECGWNPRGASFRETGGAADAGSLEATVAARVLRQVLLVVVLGVIEGRFGCDLGRDAALSRLRQLRLAHLARSFRRGELPEQPLGAPEAAHAEDGALDACGEGRLERSSEDQVTCGDAHRFGTAGDRFVRGGHP